MWTRARSHCACPSPPCGSTVLVSLVDYCVPRCLPLLRQAAYPSLTPALGPILIAPRHRRPLVPSRVPSTQVTQRGYRPLTTPPTACLPLSCDLCTSCILRVSISTNRLLICLSTSGRPIFAGIYSALHQLVSPAITFSFIVYDTCIIPIQKRLQSSCLAFSFAAVISAVCNLSYPSLQMTTPVVWCHVVA